MQQDPTNPTYYQKGDLQTFDLILAVCAKLPGDEAACVDDVLKYVVRYKQKNGLQDLEKARWYLNRLIDIVGGKNAEKDSAK